VNQEGIKNHLDGVYAEVEEHLGIKLRGCFFAGGCIVSLVNDEEISDYDLWFEREIEVDRVLAFVKNPKRKSRFSVTIELASGKLVQLVKTRCLGSPEATVGTFDFQHTQAFYTRAGRLWCDEEFLKKKMLVYNQGNRDHLTNTMERMFKFVRRGYFVNKKTIVDFLLDAHEVSVEAIAEGRRIPGKTNNGEKENENSSSSSDGNSVSSRSTRRYGVQDFSHNHLRGGSR